MTDLRRVAIALTLAASWLFSSEDRPALALSVSSLGVPVEIDFDNYLGTGFQAGGGVGTLDSDIFAAQFNAYDENFDPIISSSVDYEGSAGMGVLGRGISSSVPAQDGYFSLDLGSGNYALGIKSLTGQPDYSFSAYVELRLLNTTDKVLNQFRIEYDLLFLNSADSFLYADGHIGSNDENVSDVGGLLFETPEEADSSPNWTVSHFDAFLYLPYFGFDQVEPVEPGEYFVVGLSVGPLSNTNGLFDSVAWDNIRITALPEPNSLTIAMLMISVVTYRQRHLRKNL